MLTLQDLQAITDENEKVAFLINVINQHKGCEDYKTATIANEYDRQQNTTICNYRRFLYNLRGEAIPDKFKANYQLPSNFFQSFVTQQNQYLLGNGIQLTNEENNKEKAAKEKEKLGKGFDTALQKAGRAALVEKCSFGFWNLDHLEVFKFTEFAPLYDEENGGLGAGVRFWRIDDSKPLRFTLYELDGYTDYIQRTGEKPVELHAKRPYKLVKQTTGIDGTRIIDGENYPNFPIIPLWGNPYHQSSLIGIRSKIDCYDLIQSGFANDLDSAASIYWILHNAGGMDDIDLAQFVERMKLLGAASVDTDGGAGAEAHTLEVPYQARESYLTRLEADMYKDFQIFNCSSVTAGQKTATEILAAYQPMDTKVDQYEYCVTEFLEALFKIVGVEGDPLFKRNRIANQTEETNMVMTAANYLDDEAILNHIPWLTPDEVQDILDRKANDDTERLLGSGEENINEDRMEQARRIDEQLIAAGEVIAE